MCGGGWGGGGGGRERPHAKKRKTTHTCRGARKCNTGHRRDVGEERRKRTRTKCNGYVMGRGGEVGKGGGWETHLRMLQNNLVCVCACVCVCVCEGERVCVFMCVCVHMVSNVIETPRVWMLPLLCVRECVLVFVCVC